MVVINQPLLPHRFALLRLRNHRQTAHAIQTMIVRGAGTIGATAGYGMAQAFLEGADLGRAYELLLHTRPTAVDLKHAIDRVRAARTAADAVAEADRIADEYVARAKHHAALKLGHRGQYFGLTYWTPNINIFRDPRWGRGQETYGECPYLTARLGVAFIQGLQGRHPRYLKLVATARHFAVHSGPEPLRQKFNAVVSARDLRETYLPHFKAAVQEAKVASIMGAYNRVNGEPCCGSPTLLQKILWEEWGFDGYVVSDCWAIKLFHETHGVTKNSVESVALAARHGCDINCGCLFLELIDAVKRGLITEAELDRNLSRLFTARFKLGMFDPPSRVPWSKLSPKVVHSPKHQALGRRMAQESIVLLKNNGVLPLPKRVKSLLVAGPRNIRLSSTSIWV